MEREFDFIQYQHISRNLNTLTDLLENYVLDRHLQHLKKEAFHQYLHKDHVT